ncbi:hypothetical protein, partial [Pseudomonas syringae group genomosp. 7]|uniref:hypothetical protein n=1 Tax=Pseudomonas syringae group genomosp. 7 TaxID=251699 RepID=UPI00376FC9BB
VFVFFVGGFVFVFVFVFGLSLVFLVGVCVCFGFGVVVCGFLVVVGFCFWLFCVVGWGLLFVWFLLLGGLLLVCGLLWLWGFCGCWVVSCLFWGLFLWGLCGCGCFVFGWFLFFCVREVRMLWIDYTGV